MTLSKANFATPQRLHLLPSRKILCILASRVARGPEAKKRIKYLFCRWAAVCPYGIFLGPASGVGLR